MAGGTGIGSGEHTVSSSSKDIVIAPIVHLIGSEVTSVTSLVGRSCLYLKVPIDH